MNKEIYLDNSATTRCLSSVAELMTKIMCEDYGNPSSMHSKGVAAEKYVTEAREIIAKIIKCQPKEILFTSGGTESDNLALIGTAMANKRSGNHIITTCIEHPAIYETTEYLKSLGFEITYLSVDNLGRINLEELKNAITDQTILVSMMHTNNEIGARLQIEEAGALIKKVNPHTLFHVDAVQGFGKAKIYPKKCGIDMMSVSGHKIHGPKGIGFLYINDKTKINPICYGGGQQKGMRSGTENVPGIAGLAEAAKAIYADFDADIDRMYELKQYFISEIRKTEGITVNGITEDIRDCAPHIISVSVEGIRAEVLLHSLEDKGIYVSSGSACASNKPAISSTLKAIGVKKELLDSTIRISMSSYTTKEELDYTLQCMNEIIPMLRKYTRH